MRPKEPACWDAVEAALDCVTRGTVLLQNIAEHSDRAHREDVVRRLAGLSAAAHRNWREANASLIRIFISPIEREDISLLLHRLALLTDGLYQTALVWHTAPPGAAAWTAALATGGQTLRALVEELPQFKEEHSLSDHAETVYAILRETDTLWRDAPETSRAAAALRAATERVSAVADTVLWIALKST